jgi:hypothetical protein
MMPHASAIEHLGYPNFWKNIAKKKLGRKTLITATNLSVDSTVPASIDSGKYQGKEAVGT